MFRILPERHFVRTNTCAAPSPPAPELAVLKMATVQATSIPFRWGEKSSAAPPEIFGMGRDGALETPFESQLEREKFASRAGPMGKASVGHIPRDRLPEMNRIQLGSP